MKTIVYDFADGKKKIEVSDEIAELYVNILKYEKKVNRKETRRHVSLNVMLDAGFDFPDPTSDIEAALDREEEEKREHEMAEQEERYLEQERLWLESRLTPRQAEAYFMFVYLEMKKVEIAEEMDVTEGAVRKLIIKAEDNLAKLQQKEIQEKSGKKPLSKKENEELNLRLLNALFRK